MSLLDAVPRAPSWRVDYAALEARHAALRRLRDCPQDPLHHAEGDVGLHTQMVIESLCALPAYRALDDDGRACVFVACLLHDIAKPFTTVVGDDGRVTAKGHSSKGAITARRWLWEMGVPWRQREAICGLIRWHQVPFFLVDKGERAAERGLLRLAENCRADWLALVAEADMRGRVCADQQKILDAIELFRVAAADLGVFGEGAGDGRYAFASDHARFRYFRDERRTRFDDAYDDTRCTVTIVSGLPAVGKSRWIDQQGLSPAAVVSLDALRDELDVDAADAQRAVVDVARERLRERLRKHHDTVWNATSLSRLLRGNVVDIADAYGARVRVVAFEAAADVIAARNRERDATRVPAAAIERMLSRWEFPDGAEAHVVDVEVSG